MRFRKHHKVVPVHPSGLEVFGSSLQTVPSARMLVSLADSAELIVLLHLVLL